MNDSIEQTIRKIIREELAASSNRHEPNPAPPPPVSGTAEFDIAVRRAVDERVEEIRNYRTGRTIMFLPEAAEHTGVPAWKLKQLRLNGIGPASTFWGNKIAYDEADLNRWLHYRKNGLARGVPDELEDFAE